MAVEKIIIGRNRKEARELGSRGAAFIGKHIVGESRLGASRLHQELRNRRTQPAPCQSMGGRIEG